MVVMEKGIEREGEEGGGRREDGGGKNRWKGEREGKVTEEEVKGEERE